MSFNMLMKPKLYIKIFSFIMVVFIIYHLTIYSVYTSKIFNIKDGYVVGDLSRISYQYDSVFLRKNENTLGVTHFYKDNYNNEEVDIVTLGDSFFNGGAGGKNSYIQDYIVKYSGYKTLNIINYDPYISQIKVIEKLIDLGWFEQVKPKYFILEGVTRSLYNKFDFKKEIELTDNNFLKNIVSPGQELFTYTPSIPIISTANYKIPFYTFKYKVNENAHKMVYKFNLSKSLFSVDSPKSLLVYDQDIENIKYFNDKTLKRVNQKINDLSLKLEKLGIELIFVIAVNKYDLYYDFIINKNYPKDTFLERFDKLNKNYLYVNTKKILQPLLEKGEKDIFYADDTHWSYKANDIIAQQLALILKEKR